MGEAVESVDITQRLQSVVSIMIIRLDKVSPVCDYKSEAFAV
jgi:hypothetical protein